MKLRESLFVNRERHKLQFSLTINVSRLTINVFQLVRRTRTRASWIAAGTAWPRSTRCRPTCRGADSERRELLLQFGGFAGGTGRHRRTLHDHLKAVIAFLTDIFKGRK